MGSPAYYGMDYADLSTVNANPSIYSGADLSTADQVSQIANTAGQWGSTIASIVTGNPVSTVATPGGGVQTIGAAGSTFQGAPSTPMSSTSMLLILGIVVIGIFFLMEEKKK